MYTVGFHKDTVATCDQLISTIMALSTKMYRIHLSCVICTTVHMDHVMPINRSLALLTILLQWW